MKTNRIRMESDSDNTFYHIFYSNTNTDLNVLEYKYKMDVLISETHSNSYRFGTQHLLIFFIHNLQLQNYVETKVLVRNRDRSLRISLSSIFILIINHIINKIINKYIFLIFIYTFIKQNNKKYMRNIFNNTKINRVTKIKLPLIDILMYFCY
jgi:hypothetical protein